MVVVKKYHQFFFIITILLVSSSYGLAQNSGLLQQIDLSDNYRLYQLTDSLKTAELGIQNHSFMIRPLKFVEKNQKNTKFLQNLEQKKVEIFLYIAMLIYLIL